LIKNGVEEVFRSIIMPYLFNASSLRTHVRVVSKMVAPISSSAGALLSFDGDSFAGPVLVNQFHY
jgi:hypothetical protein